MVFGAELILWIIIFLNGIWGGIDSMDNNSLNGIWGGYTKSKLKRNKINLNMGFGFNFINLKYHNNMSNNNVVNGFFPISFSYEHLIIYNSKKINSLEISINKDLTINKNNYYTYTNNDKIYPFEFTLTYKFYSKNYNNLYIGPLLGINSGIENFELSSGNPTSRYLSKFNAQLIFGLKFGLSILISNSVGINIEDKIIIGTSNAFFTNSIQIGPFVKF